VNLDAFLPLYGNDFFQATEGRTDAVVVGYLRALWHYWHHHHCEGLPNDDDFLRRLCRIEISEWKRTRDVIFGEYFKLVDGKWHQPRAREEYAVRSTAYERKAEAMAKARSANPNNQQDSQQYNQQCPRASDSGSRSFVPGGEVEEGRVELPPRRPEPGPAADCDELPQLTGEQTKYAGAVLAHAMNTGNLKPLDRSIQKLRANIYENLMRGQSADDLMRLCSWAVDPDVAHLAGVPHGVVNALNPDKVGTFLQTMVKHRAQLEYERKRRNR
jgi:uncharacterized protein YdaU (DUF1376 family)